MFRFNKTRNIAAVFTAAMASLNGGICLAQAPAYQVKPSDVVVPQDVPIGQYRRIFRPFENWTLICDENLKVRQMVCNVSQSITDTNGAVVFSWSLAAAEGGQPFFILRTVADSNTGTGIEVKVAGANVVKVPFDGCNPSVCLGKTPVTPALAQAIEKGAQAMVSYRLRSGQMREMHLPLKGLNDAVVSINPSGAAPPARGAAAKPATKEGMRPAAASEVKDKGKLAIPPAAGSMGKP